MDISKMTKEELTQAINEETSLRELFKNSLDSYTVEELREVTHGWIVSGNEAEY